MLYHKKKTKTPICSTHITNLVMLQAEDTLWHLLVSCGPMTKATVVSIAECVQLAICCHHCTVLEAYRHLNNETNEFK